MKTISKKFLYASLLFTILFSVPFLKASYDDILLNTLDHTEDQGKSGKIPSFTISKTYTVTYIGAYFGDISNKTSPSVRCWLMNQNNKKVAGGELTSESGLNVASAIYSNTGTFQLEAGTYEFYTDTRELWKINKDGYFQVLIKGYSK